jgi:hypothetical protein
MVWAAMKIHIRMRLPKTYRDLQNSINEFVSTLTAEVCAKYIDNLRKTIRIVIDKGGRWSGRYFFLIHALSYSKNLSHIELINKKINQFLKQNIKKILIYFKTL